MARVRERPLWWMALAAASALFPEIALPAYSVAVFGYLTLTPDLTWFLAIVLPCASLALFASVFAAYLVWPAGGRQNLAATTAMSGLGALLAWAAAENYWTGGVTCHGCGFAWFFLIIFPCLLLELAAGLVWVLLLLQVRRTPAIGIRASTP